MRESTASSAYWVWVGCDTNYLKMMQLRVTIINGKALVNAYHASYYREDNTFKTVVGLDVGSRLKKATKYVGAMSDGGSGYGVKDIVWSMKKQQRNNTGEDDSSAAFPVCSHPKDVWVSCVAERKVRLVDGGENPYVGRLEINVEPYAGDQKWSSVCDDGFDVKAGEVACKELFGYKLGAIETFGKRQGGGSGAVVADGVSCEGTEKSVRQCKIKSIPFGGKLEGFLEGYVGTARRELGHVADARDVELVSGIGGGKSMGITAHVCGEILPDTTATSTASNAYWVWIGCHPSHIKMVRLRVTMISGKAFVFAYLARYKWERNSYKTAVGMNVATRLRGAHGKSVASSDAQHGYGVKDVVWRMHTAGSLGGVRPTTHSPHPTPQV